MHIEFVIVKAHSGAKCRSCPAIIVKGELALKVEVSGSAQTGDREFHCLECVPKNIVMLENVIAEWKKINV
jgi:hypothetical protein